MKQVEPEHFTRFLERIGIPTEVDPHPSIALGSCDLSLYEMMWAYTIFPSGGIATKPYIISRIEDRNGNVLKRFEPGKQRKEVINEVSAYRMFQMMQGTVTIGTAKGLMDRLGATEMAGKTGTTNDNADAWFMGYTPQLLAGSWIGCDDRFIRIESGLGMGSQAARPIWEAFFKKVYADGKSGIKRDMVFNKPPELLINTDSLVMKELMDAGLMGNEGTDPMEDDFSGDYFGSPKANQNPAAKPGENKPKAVMPPKKSEGRARDPKIGEATEPQEEKKGFLKKLFGKKEE